MKDYERYRALILQRVTPSIHLCACKSAVFAVVQGSSLCALVGIISLQIGDDGKRARVFGLCL